MLRRLIDYLWPPKATAQHPVEKAFAKMTRYHYYFFAWLFIAKVPLFWRVLGLIFLTPPMDYVCIDDPNSTSSKNTCPCKNPEWDHSVFTKTLATKFDLYCDRKWLQTLLQIILYVGSLIGSLCFGFISDKIGRLSSFMITILILVVFGVLNAWVCNLYGYIIVRCIEGIGIGGSIVTSFVLCVEYCGAKNREIMVALYHIPINIGHISLAGVSFAVRDCDNFQLVISVPITVFLLMNWLTHESPKWLLDKNRIDDAYQVMEKIGKFNKKPFENIKEEMEAYQAAKSSAGEQQLSFTKIFNYKHLTRNFFCMSVNYFGCGAGYYGVSQFVGQMSGDIHKNVAINGATLIPGTLIATFLLIKMGRRPLLMITNILAGICMLICVAMPASAQSATVIIASIGCCFFFMSFITVFLYGVELFPTSIRNAVLGVLSMLSRLGQIVAPIINLASQTAAGLIFGIIAIIAGILCIPLPETKGKELPTTIEDIQEKQPSKSEPAIMKFMVQNRRQRHSSDANMDSQALSILHPTLR